MIRTDAEYSDTRRRSEGAEARLRTYEASLRERGMAGEDLDIVLDPMRVHCAELRDKLVTYDRLKRGDLGRLRNFKDTGRLLVALRIASRMSQKALADRLGVHESQVSRDERNEYHGVALERASRIAEVLTAALNCKVVTEVVARRPKVQVHDEAARDPLGAIDNLALAA